MTNITSHHINVDIQFINKDGVQLSPTVYSNFAAGNTQLAPGKSGYVYITTAAFDYGYATIEWSNVEGEDDTYALIAHANQLVVEAALARRATYSISVNDGKPF